MPQAITRCANCLSHQKSRYREFSDQVWTLLLQWGEIEKSTINKPICDACYQDIRELLIDKSHELEKTFATGIINVVETQSQQAKVNEAEKNKIGIKKTAKNQKAGGGAEKPASKKSTKVSKAS
ncbi:MAG: hypothetical protein HQK54_06705 [Oligoflexales bacterium]|nr:hypothetical protein [Oligoflexales bacterium]